MKRLLLGLPLLTGAAIAVFLILSSRGGPTISEAGAPGTCTESFERFGGLAGHWEGTWENHTFNSSGDLTVDASIFDYCSAQAIIDGIFSQDDPHTVVATYRDDGANTVVEVRDDPIFGDVDIVITAGGAMTLEAMDAHQGIESADGTGTVAIDRVTLEMTLTFQGGGTAEESIELTRVVTPTPSPSPTPLETATPTATATAMETATPTPSAGPALVQGNVDCGAGGVDSVDALKVLLHVAQLPTSQPPGCPGIGTDVASLWGDVDCSDAVDSVDALKILLHVAQLPVAPVAGCPEIGTAV